jgi:RNA polymerase sigma factor (sigma-70 family)
MIGIVIELTMTWITTTQILTNLQQGHDPSAWQGFCRHFTPAIVSFGRKLGLSPEEAEDAAQETLLAFIKAWQQGRYQRDKGRLSSWLFGFAKRIILKTRQQRPRERTIGSTTQGDDFWSQVPDDETLLLTWESQWKRVVLTRCLDRLREEADPKVFAAFSRYALQEQTADQVAEQLGMSRNAVYIAKCRMLTRLRELERDLQDVDLEAMP